MDLEEKEKGKKKKGDSMAKIGTYGIYSCPF